jgi:hypothetical protein
MGKFYGEIGYAETKETSPGVWVETGVVKRQYYGDIIRNTRRIETSNGANDDINVDNLISVMADAYAYQNFSTIRYVKWMGVAWKVPKVEVQRPRLILTIGGVYNGPQS